MPAKRKLLPPDFDAVLADGDLDAAIAVFDVCRVDAYQRNTRATALHSFHCTAELARWLVARGLDVDAPSLFGDTALAVRAMHDQDMSALLELGANVNATNRSGFTVLHRAVPRSPRNVEILLARGADMYAENDEGHTPLASALARCSNAEVVAVAGSARILLDAGSPVPADAADHVAGIAARCAEIAQEGPRQERLTRSVAELCALFDVAAAAPRRTHDGISPITVTAGRWPEQFDELWGLLVPPGGVAATLQGEVIRLAGRISDELRGNGGVNWDRDYRAMAMAMLGYLSTGATVSTAGELADLASGIKRDFHDRAVLRLGEMAVAWVLANPDPMLVPPYLTYRR